MTTRIPASVLKMISRVWPHRNAQYAEPLIANVIRNDYPHPPRGKRFSAARDEIQSLIADGVLMNLADKDDTSLVIDNQEKASLDFFCAEVYFAWSEHQARMKRWRRLREQAEHRKNFADHQERLIARQQQTIDRHTGKGAIQ